MEASPAPTGVQVACRDLPGHFVYVWVYEVPPEKISEFLDVYGPDGPWCEMFRRAEGYLGTELLEDRRSAVPSRTRASSPWRRGERPSRRLSSTWWMRDQERPALRGIA